ncbi:hypothetical protein BN1050_00616 [Metalysinibacillus saudimassiliensis]|uniref:Uncharacterized protein n=1 Tax=Metalysinibacillus saudimassiliensis TaxID=1461583 RepID=A0A078LZ99_9BACL|nr:hypothetical protein BN1050_00616 [Metalysinibacillus saudimassiliensis]
MKRLWQICFAIGIIMMVGRLATALLDRMGVETTTFFFALQIPSMIVLIVGIIGLEVTGKSNK